MKISRILRCYLVTSLLAVTHLANAFRVIHQKGHGRPQSLPRSRANERKLYFKDGIPAEQTTGSLGSSLSLDCEAGGSPSPTIHWLFNGERIIQGRRYKLSDDEALFENSQQNHDLETLRLGSTKSRLYIDCLSHRTVGEFTCVAETPYKRISTTTVVSIDSETNAHHANAACVRKRVGTATPARIFMWTAQRLEFEGADVQLFCRADGSPSTTIKWLDQQGTPITEQQNQYSVLENGDLLVRRINWLENMGLYTCVAENEHGSDQQGIFLYPTSP